MHPSTHFWLRKQKWVIVAAIAALLTIFGILIYSYERYHRGPTDAVFVGTWEMEDGCIDCTHWITLRADHNVVGFSDSLGRLGLDYRGRWYAGGQLLVVHYDREEEAHSVVMRILDIAPDTIRVRSGGREMRMTRSTQAPPQASSQPLQPAPSPLSL